MTGKEFLKQIRDINITIISLQLEIERINTMLTSTTIRPKEVDVQTSGQSDPMADKVIKKVEYEDKLKEMLGRQMDIKEQALKLIDSLDRQEDKSFLMLRYLNCMSYKQIMDKTEMSLAGIKKRLSEAEKRFNILFDSHIKP